MEEVFTSRPEMPEERPPSLGSPDLNKGHIGNSSNSDCKHSCKLTGPKFCPLMSGQDNTTCD